MNLEKRTVEREKFDLNRPGVIILPANFESDVPEEHNYHSTTLSFYKYAKDRMEVSCLNTPERLLEQRSGEWFAPVLLITSTAIAENPQIVSITCGVIANYVTDFFKGMKKPNVRMKILHKETRATTLTEISYEGSIDGLDEIADAILEIAKGTSRDA